ADGVDQDGRQGRLGLQVHQGRETAQVAVDHVRPFRAAELLAGLAEQRERGAVGGERHVRAAADVVVDAEDAHDGGRVDRRVARLVVEADVAAGDRDAEVVAGVRQALDRAGELPHDARVLRGAEVEAVGDGQGPRARGGDVAVRLGQRQLRARVRVQPGVPAVPVEGQRDAQAGLLVDADDARVVRHRQDRV